MKKNPIWDCSVCRRELDLDCQADHVYELDLGLGCTIPHFGSLGGIESITKQTVGGWRALWCGLLLLSLYFCRPFLSRGAEMTYTVSMEPLNPTKQTNKSRVRFFFQIQEGVIREGNQLVWLTCSSKFHYCSQLCRHKTIPSPRHCPTDCAVYSITLILSMGWLML